MFKRLTYLTTGKWSSESWRRYHTFRVFIRGRIHLIPGHPSINDEANTLFEAYQKQASEGIIQFRRWPLRNVSLSIICFRIFVPCSHHRYEKHKCRSLIS